MGDDPQTSGPRRRRRRSVLPAVLLVLVVGGAAGWHWFLGPTYRRLEIALGYAAQVAAGQRYITGEPLARIHAERIPSEFADLVSLESDDSNGVVTASAFGVLKRSAKVRAGLGVTRESAAAKRLPLGLPDLVSPPPADQPWPAGSAPSFDPPDADVDHDALTAAINDAFVDAESGLSRQTHAVLVVHRGRIVAERYRPEYDHRTPLLGWSMTKSVTATLIGRLVHDGVLRIEDPAPVPEWSDAADPRHAITIDDLLRMQSGLAFFNNYTRADSDSLRMLFVSDDVAAYAAAKPAAAPPGTRWEYSDGTANILAGIVRRSGGATAHDQMTYSARALFAPLQMDTAVICVDGSGTFVGSSLMYASPRDWARVGLLYLRDGVWNGERLLPEGWLDYVSTPAAHAPDERYGAQFWRLRTAEGSVIGPELDGVIYASGYDDQDMFIDPKRDLLILRFGMDPPTPGFSVPRFVSAVSRAFPSDAVATPVVAE